MRLVAVIALLAACHGPKDDDVADSTDHATDTDTDVGTDTEVPRDTGVGDTGVTYGPDDLFASVSVRGSTDGAYATADFYAYIETSTSTSSSTTGGPLELDGCRIYDFSGTSGTTEGGATIVPVDPGEATVTVGGDAYLLEPQPGDYFAVTLDGWAAGASVDVSVAGGEFPAFDVQGLIQLPTIPAVPDAFLAPIDRAQDLVVTWTPADGDPTLFLYSGDIAVFCDFADADASGTVTSAVLQRLPAGAASATLERTAVGLASLPSGPFVVVFADAGDATTVTVQ